MIKQKAPKDMTATEFVEHLELVASREMLAKNTEGWAITLQGIRRELSEPAPNPFTEDQLAWMRVMQELGYSYAAKDDGYDTVWIYENIPVEQSGTWDGTGFAIEANGENFLDKIISSDDPEPLYFADYAPLEEK